MYFMEPLFATAHAFRALRLSKRYEKLKSNVLRVFMTMRVKKTLPAAIGMKGKPRIFRFFQFGNNKMLNVVMYFEAFRIIIV